MLRLIGIGLLVLSGGLIAGFVAWLELPTHWPATARVTAPNPRVGQYYLALGDSLAFGFQPNLDWSHSYAMQWWPELQRHGSEDLADYACMDETTETFIHGGCPYSKFRHDYYDGPQLEGALEFLDQHSGDTGPVSLQIGWNDVARNIAPSTCEVDRAGWRRDLARMDRDLTRTILPELVGALSADGRRTGDLVMLSYYDPYASRCPRLHGYVVQLDEHLTRDASRFGVPMVDVASAFRGRSLCDYTWACSQFARTEPNTRGYRLIARALERRMGY